MYRNALPFTELIINGGFLKSLEDSQAECLNKYEVRDATEEEKSRLYYNSNNDDYTVLSNMKATTDIQEGCGGYIDAQHNMNYLISQYDQRNPCERPITEYQHSMEMRLEEDNLNYSFQHKSFIVDEKKELTEPNISIRSGSPHLPCWPIPMARSHYKETDAERRNLQSSLLPDYQTLRWGTINGATTDQDTYNYEIYPSLSDTSFLSEANKENALNIHSNKSTEVARPFEEGTILDSPAEAPSLQTCAQRFQRALQLSLERDGFVEGTINKVENSTTSAMYSPMREYSNVQLLDTPVRSGYNEQKHGACDNGFSKETSSSMEYAQTPRHILRKIPTKFFENHNEGKDDLSESICALNYSLISDGSPKTNDQISSDSENLRTPKVDDGSLESDYTPLRKRLSDEFVSEDGNLDDTIFDIAPTPTTNGTLAPCTSTTRRKRRKKALTLKKKHRVEPVATISIVKDYFDQAYDLSVSEDALIEATASSLTLEGIQDANEARSMYLEKTTLSKTGRTNFVNFGLDYRIQALYKSSYPPRYSLLNELFICRTCFQYFTSGDAVDRHMKKCSSRKMPPGTEIYRDKKNYLSIFLVEGDKESIYCSNLSLLTMFWLRDKVVYLDVEPFTYYVVARPNGEGNFLPLGYFSKQRENGENHNLCCFCVFPCFQKQGLGRFIIDFSYAISRLENNPGGPERPFSSLGEIAYKSYWFETLIQISADIMQNKMDNKISTIVRKTGMQESDVIETLTEMFPDIKQKKKRTLVLPVPEDKNFIYEAALEISVKREQLRIHDEFFSPNFLKSLGTL